MRCRATFKMDFEDHQAFDLRDERPPTGNQTYNCGSVNFCGLKRCELMRNCRCPMARYLKNSLRRLARRPHIEACATRPMLA
jgi:hypothetical protein